MTVTLNQTRVRPDDQRWDVTMIGVNYASQRVVVRVTFQSGDTTDIVFEDAALLDLRNSVSQFSGLRAAVEQYIVNRRADLAGNVS